MSVIFDYAVSFSEKTPLPSVSLGFLRKVGVFVKPKQQPQSASDSPELLAIEVKPKKTKAESVTKSVVEYVMIEVMKDTYQNFTDNVEIAGFFDSGMNSIFLIMNKSEASGISEAKDLNVNEFMTACYSSDFTMTEAKTMLIDGFNGTYIATSSIEQECIDFQVLSDVHMCFIDFSESNKAYGMCAAIGYHLGRVYWRNNQYWIPSVPSKISGVNSAAQGRVFLDKGISFFISDKQYGTFLGFFGNKKQGIAEPYIYEEVKLKSKEALTLWTQKNEPTGTVMNRILAEKAANEPFRMYEEPPYNYLDSDFKNKAVISKSNEKYHASGAMEFRIPSPTWVYDIEASVSN